MNESQELRYDTLYRQETVKTTYTRLEHIGALCAVLMGFLYIRLVQFHPNGLLTTCYFWALFAAELFYLKRSGIIMTMGTKLMAGLLFVFGGIYTATADPILHGLTTVFLVLSSALFLLGAGDIGKALKYLPVSLSKAAFLMPFLHFHNTFPAAVSGMKGRGFWRNFGYAAAGLALALPMTAAVAVLLSYADEGVSQMLGRIMRVDLSSLYLVALHLLIGIPVGALIFSCLYAAAHRRLELDETSCTQVIRACRIVPLPMICAAVTPICLLYVLYAVSQLNYFLGGFFGDLYHGYTYAGYARKGFFELCGICGINLLVITAMGFLTRRSDEKRPAVLRIYSVFLCISSLFLAGTAIAKMIMYISVYGMTRLRIYTTWFMVLLVIGFILLSIRQFYERLPLGKIGFAVFAVMFGALCFSRPDAWMTRYNADMYLTGQLEEFDAQLLDELSEDAWAALSHYDVQQLTALDETLPHRVHVHAQNQQRDFWRELNLSAWELIAHEAG